MSSTPNFVNDENPHLDRGLRLSRPPHPYHRTRIDITGSEQRADSTSTFSQQDPYLATSSTLESGNHGGDYFNSNDCTTWRRSTSPSESGTEADDESANFLRVLPAPPTKLRKGLKDARGSAVSSPLLTPTYFDDDRQRSLLETRLSCAASFEKSAVNDEESIRIREKLKRRRRAELFRRFSETVLLSAVGVITCGNGPDSVLYVRKNELKSYFYVLLYIYLLYPVRVLYCRHAISKGKTSVLPNVRIPISFDPAPLLYPLLLPVFVAISLATVKPEILLPNLVLGLSSIPSAIIPFHNKSLSINPAHWVLSLIPIMIVQREESFGQIGSMRTSRVFHDSLDIEIIAVLYPLHQALLPLLSFLTTTSLLPAELQLLSISMINLLLFSSSPQALILKILLWAGGISVFLLCSRVLKMGVELARIPSWRFRHTQHQSRRGFVFLEAIDDYLDGRLSRWRLISTASTSSDSDDGLSTMRVSQWSGTKNPRVELCAKKHSSSAAPRSAIDGNMWNGLLDSFPKPTDRATLPNKQVKRSRRHTLPRYDGKLPKGPFSGKPNFVARSKSLRNRPHLLSLTNSQAIVIKWCFAVYVYAIVLIIILVPVRIAVARLALHNREPFGWALGYLLGDLLIFRSIVARLKLDWWIFLPARTESDEIWRHDGKPGFLHHLGPADIRLIICTHCIITIVLGLRIVFWLTSFVEVDTRRKIFHGMMVIMFLPSILIDPPFAALALALALAIFLLLDLFRASQLPPLSRPLTYFLAPYVDGRDHRGPVIVSHIFLLIGCAIPLWLSLAAIDRTGIPPWEGWDLPLRELSMASGVICVGMGDAAASLFGRRFGRRRWCWSGGKSLEGSLAFVLAVVLGLVISKLYLRFTGWDGDHKDSWIIILGKYSLAATGASLTEAVLTGGNDNVIVPVVLWLLVRGLGI